MNVALSGSRTFTDRDLVELVVERRLQRGDFIIIGDAPRGVDDFAWHYLKGVDQSRWRRERAHWKTLGGYAGHERNGRMLVDADELIAMFANELTPGTTDALDQAMLKNITAYVYHTGTWMTIAGRKNTPTPSVGPGL